MIHPGTRVSDVLIVGAGAAGLLVARDLDILGFSVTIMDSGAVASEQSNHSHGYLHRGYIYQSPQANFVRSLNRGADLWLEHFRSAGIEPSCDTSIIGFTNQYNGNRAALQWEGIGLPVSKTSIPGSSEMRGVWGPNREAGALPV